MRFGSELFLQWEQECEATCVRPDSFGMTDNDTVSRTFRALVESANRKFARVRDVAVNGRFDNHHYFQKVFKAYLRLWKYQQEFRRKLVESGLNRWEIGEIASRIGQLYYGQYMRSSETRFLIEAYVFYEAIMRRRYFDGSKGSGKDLGVRFKELRFCARFLLVSLILNRTETVKTLSHRLKSLVDDTKVTFQDTDCKEWREVVQEIYRFMEVDTTSMNVRPLRYCPKFDIHPASLPHVSRFHAKRILKFQHAVLTSYRKNEVKFAELALDTYRMLQCLEWEPNEFFCQSHPVESNGIGVSVDDSGTSGLIDINLAADMIDTSLQPNPRKSFLYRPSVSHLIAVLATICEELLPDSIMLIYLSAEGKGGQTNVSQMESFGGSAICSRSKVVSQNSHSQGLNNSLLESHKNGKAGTIDLYDDYLSIAPRSNRGSNALYPGDIIPFTRRPVFLIVDSNDSHAFKSLHGTEIVETAALFLSPMRPIYKNPSNTGMIQTGSQFTFFLTAPLPAFCEMIGLTSGDTNSDIYKDAETLISTAFSEWESILCTSANLNLVWSQVLSDHFLRRLILRFIFCQAVLSLVCSQEENDQYLPVCLPILPESVSPRSEAVKSAVIRLAEHLSVANWFLSKGS